MSNQSISSCLIAILAILPSSLAYFFSTGFHDCWFLTWLGPLSILLYGFYHRQLATFIVNFIAYFLGGLNSLWFYLHTLLPTVQPLLIGLILEAIVFAGVILLTCYMVRRWQKLDITLGNKSLQFECLGLDLN